MQPISGLPTHFRLELELENMIARMRQNRDRQGFALLIMQLGDNWALVRKTLKSTISEWVLYQTGCRIASVLRPQDKIFHTNESEFFLLLPHLKEKELASVVHSIIALISEPHFFPGFNVVLKPHAGVAYWPEHGEERSEILHHSDMAIAAAHDSRKELVFFSFNLEAEALERLSLQNAMIHAIETSFLDRISEQFLLYFQPKIFAKAIENNIVHVERISCEALIRWKHPERGMIMPSAFIPIAEETGLILPLGKWIIYQCARRLGKWISEGRKGLSLSLNLSARQFQSGSVGDILESAVLSGALPKDSLIVELTETCLFENPETTAAIVEHFSDIGVRVSVDDFGTGYSSLSHLHRFEIDELKIDKLFISELDKNRQDQVIVSSLVQIAKGLELDLVAEGVEHTDVLQTLWNMGCTGFQGYLFAKPMPPEDFIAYYDAIVDNDMRIAL